MGKNKNMIKDIASDMISDIDKPFELSDSWSFLKKGKLKVVIHYEDKSYIEYFIKLKDDYTVRIKKRSYFLIPECVIYGKYNSIEYFFNNPFPINFEYEMAKAGTKKIKEALNINDATKIDIKVDAKVLDTALNSNLIAKMYDEGSMMTTKNIILMVVVGLVVILVLLQAFGVVDVLGFLTGGVK